MYTRGERKIISLFAREEEPPLIRKRFVNRFKKNKKTFVEYKKQLREYSVKTSQFISFVYKKSKSINKQLAIVALSIVLVFINSNNAYANEYLSDNVLGEKDTIILGSNQEISSATETINQYLAYKQKPVNIVSNDEIVTDDFVSKPLVPETESRKAIEEEKRQEELKASQTLAYANYATYNTYYTQDYSRNTITRDVDDREISSSNPNSYYYGYCTWYVASQKDVPSFWGNAGQWLYSAQSSGYETGYNAQNDSIIVTNESGYGHVGIVESVNEDTITISEMNYAGWGTINTREISKDSPIIKGYIY